MFSAFSRSERRGADPDPEPIVHGVADGHHPHLPAVDVRSEL